MESNDESPVEAIGTIKSNGNKSPKGQLPALIPNRRALILYGSETGNAQDIADEVGRLTERLHFDTTVLDLDSVQLRELVRPTLVIFVVSTTGQGEFPQNARGFWKLLLSSALKPGILRKLRFSSFGLGDSSYAQYNVVHRSLHARLVQLGAQPFCERGEGNEQHPEGHSAGFREWSLLLRRQLIDTFPLPDGVEPINDDVFIEPQWKLQRIETETETVEDEIPRSDTAATPSATLLPIRDACIATIEQNQRVTAADHFQDVRLLDLRIPQSIPYAPGAVAVVYPKNFPEDVDRFIELMGWESIADRPINLNPNPNRPGNPSSPSPLRNFDLTNTRVTLRWLLENVLDIMSIPRRSFFASLAYFAGENNEDEKYQKDRLLELANPELIDELWDYTTRPKRTIVEVMMDFTTIKIPWEYVFSALPVMRGRQFSIASGGDQKTDTQGRTRVELLIAIVDPPSPIIKWRRRYGVCTRYITSLRPGMQIALGLQRGYLNVTAAEAGIPVVLIGPGTGLAPMRAMLHERLSWLSASSPKPLDTSTLFFGCRKSDADYFFSAEFSRMQVEHGLHLHVAFSRDHPAHSREYVQDQIRAQGAHVADTLLRKNGKVYVCGSSGNMPKGVRQALVEVLQQFGEEGTALEQAEEYLAKMEKDGRYKQETW